MTDKRLTADHMAVLRWLVERAERRKPMISASHASELDGVRYFSGVGEDLKRWGYTTEEGPATWNPTRKAYEAVGVRPAFRGGAYTTRMSEEDLRIK